MKTNSGKKPGTLLMTMSEVNTNYCVLTRLGMHPKSYVIFGVDLAENTVLAVFVHGLYFLVILIMMLV